MRRKFYLVNESGSTFHFDYKHNCIIEDLDGLGFDFDIEYQEFDSNFVETKRKIPQKNVSMTLIFFDGYAGFTRWRDFVSNSKELRLFYALDSGTKYCYINVSSSSKTQMESGALRTSVKFDCLSLWLVNKSYSIRVVDEGDGKKYPYSYAYRYSINFSGTITVKNESSRTIPLLIRMTGNLFKPRIEVRQGEKVFYNLRLLIDERFEPTIEINSDPTNQYIKKIKDDYVEDYYIYQDFSYDNFLFLPPGEFEIFYDPGVREPSTCEIIFKEQFIAH